MNQEVLEKLKRYCAYQERCHSEVIVKGKSLGVYGTDLDLLLLQLIKEDFLNEARFAEIYVRSKVNQKKWGPYKIAQALKLKKLSQKLITHAINQVPKETFRTNAETLLLKYVSEHSNWPKIKQKMNVKKHLISKGYSYDLVDTLILSKLGK